MTANRALANLRGVSEEVCLLIDGVHDCIQNLMKLTHHNGADEDNVFLAIESVECVLQELWRFPVDKNRHTWKHRYKFKCRWAGTKWKCNTTGVIFTVPDDVRERDFFTFGEALLDVGRREYYCRMSGCHKVEEN